MKKKVLSVLLVAAMSASLLTGCGEADTATTESGAPAASTGAAATVDPASEGKVLNVRCWNDEFQRRVKAHYPGYEEVDATHGKIGDVEVVWSIVPSDDNAYQDALDKALLAQESAATDEKVDIFLVEADYALKYVDTNYTMAVSDLGVTDADVAQQYDYTKKIVTDSNGALKGVSWQGCPGIMFYNRDIALEVLGTEDPDEVQAYVKDWATFNETAKLIKDAGYAPVATVVDSYRVYSNNVTSPWVVNGKINIDDNIMNWVNDAKALCDAGMAQNAELWSAEWSAGFYGGVFAYFGPAWLINFCMAAGEEGSVATNGRWGGTVGPQSFYWGGTWICAATGTDNGSLVADIMKKLTCDADIMKEIVEQDDDFANNVAAMEAMAASDYSSAILGGQNPLQMYMDGAANIDLSNLSAYDQTCNEAFQKAMTDYFAGNASLDEALDLFYTNVMEKHPELSR